MSRLPESGGRRSSPGDGAPPLPFDVTPYALDDDVFAATRADRATRIVVYPHPRTVAVLGRGSDPRRELRVDQIAADGVPVQRRRGGGCAVVLDPGNVIVTAVIGLPGLGEIRSTFERCTRWLIDALAGVGVPNVDTDGISDLVIGDRKVAGSCVHRSLGVFYFSASLLFAPDVALMTRYLAHPPREPEYRRGRDHAAFVTGIEAHWQTGGDVARVKTFANALQQRLTASTHALTGTSSG